MENGAVKKCFQDVPRCVRRIVLEEKEKPLGTVGVVSTGGIPRGLDNLSPGRSPAEPEGVSVSWGEWSSRVICVSRVHAQDVALLAGWAAVTPEKLHVVERISGDWAHVGVSDEVVAWCPWRA